jgi:hypothetical protein
MEYSVLVYIVTLTTVYFIATKGLLMLKTMDTLLKNYWIRMGKNTVILVSVPKV